MLTKKKLFENAGRLLPAFAVAVCMLSACSGSGGSDGNGAESGAMYLLMLPAGFPAPVVPAENPLTQAKIDLGRGLFFDRRMSINEQKSCGDCHHPDKAFTDARTVAVGITEDQVHPRNALSLTNAAYNAVFNWANPNLKTLEQQALAVLVNETPVELGWSDNEDVILGRFRSDANYPTLFAAAYPDAVDPFTVENVVNALASFERTLLSGNSAYDRENNGETGAMSDAAKRGRALFNSERLECFHCHAGFNFSQSVNHGGVVFEQIEFHNTGLYNVGGTGAYPSSNTGLWEFTHDNADMGQFRAPSLRNVALTAPYMHDGSIVTLREVIVDHYARGGRLIASGDYAGDGAQSPYKSGLVNGFQITDDEVEDLLAFLDSLTDWDFVCNDDNNDPFGNLPKHTECTNR